MPEANPAVRSLFLKALAVIYFLAFGSLAFQILGLVGSQGIVSCAPLLAQIHQTAGVHWWQFPTLAWLSSSDAMLRGLCVGGIVLSLFALTGYFPKIIFFALWLAYLSLVTVGGDFLSFQWDSLLLETGLIAVVWAPLIAYSVIPADRMREPVHSDDRWGILNGQLLVKWLLFRLMLQSGLVKWLSHDPTWAHLTALNVYYETMPIPNPLSWVMHQLPAFFQMGSVGAVFILELIVPWLIWARPLRRIVFWCFIGFQAIIFLTGNYAFFNLLTMALCISLLEDADLPAGSHFISSLQRRPSEEMKCDPGHGLAYAGRFCCAVLLWLSVVRWALMFGVRLPGIGALAALDSFRSVNTYGLFAVMTTTRPEIIVEGSNDGKTWLPYEFKYKPGKLDRCPPIVAPYQPRLDWQMWFAALGRYEDNLWFMHFCERLLQGSPPVLALMHTNPFPDRPPRFIRASLYQYRFTTWKERRATGDWWKRDPRGSYCPVLSLKG